MGDTGKNPSQTDMGRARRKQIWYPLLAGKHREVSTVPSLQLLWVSPNSPQQHRKSWQQGRERKASVKGEKSCTNVHEFPCGFSSAHGPSTAD